MTTLNDELKDYLLSSSSTSKSSSQIAEKGQSKNGHGFSFTSFFQSQRQSNGASTRELDNSQSHATGSWFSEAQKDPLCPSLTKKQRVTGFIMCLLMGTFCFSLASLYIPFLLMKARKFAMLYSLGSVFVISSFSLLWGPTNHLKHLFSRDRLLFTTAYFGTMFGTIYCAIWLQSTAFTVIFAVGQIIALLWYIISYIPGGHTGMKFFSKLFYATASKTVSSTLPV